MFIKSPFAISKIPLLSSQLHVRWQSLAEPLLWFNVCGILFYFQLMQDKEVKKGLKA